jgi:hypothetical protein
MAGLLWPFLPDGLTTNGITTVETLESSVWLLDITRGKLRALRRYRETDS